MSAVGAAAASGGEETERIVFVDIDGVVIADETYLEAASTKGGVIYDRACAARIAALCTRHEAQIVWNTSWNANVHARDTLAQASGLATLEHRERATLYGTRCPDRLEAIRVWLAMHVRRDTVWCALDDEPIASERAIRINRRVGVQEGDIERASALLGEMGRR